MEFYTPSDIHSALSTDTKCFCHSETDSIGFAAEEFPLLNMNFELKCRS